ncbi:hypothetical protein ABFX02_14G241600 [Erythranthe guttata]
MNPTALLIRKSLLQLAHVENASAIRSLPPSATAADGDSGFRPVINSSSSPAADRRPFNPTSQFDSSMALTILVLLTALFFMGFFSIYIRRFTAAEEPPPPSAATSSSSPRRPPPPPNRRGGGLDPSAVNSLPLVAYGKAGAAEHRRMFDDCPVCLTEFQEGETVKLIPYCGHVFHSKCIDTWLFSHVTCPLCRSTQLFKTAEEV